EGGKNQLTAEEPFMFATTSGTTAKPKLIPITNSHLRDYTHAFQIHNYHLIETFRRAATGRFLIITSNDEEGRTACGLPYGAVSGLLNKRQPAIIKRHFAVPFELCKIKDVDTKYYMMLRTAIAQNVTGILGCNPSSLLLLADQLKEHAEDLLVDLRNGGVNRVYAQRNPYQEAFQPFLAANPQRASMLEKMLEKKGILTPRDVWPELEIMSCWKGGPMSFYLDRLSEYYGEMPIRDFGYMASEGRGSIPISDEGAGGILAVSCHFFEFVAEEDMESGKERFLTVDQLVLGGRYYIFFTTASGLYRYNINDLVEVTDFCHATPVIKFVRKGLGVSSITGEKLTEEQVLVALTLAVKQLNMGEIDHFTAEVELANPPYYVCYAESSSGMPDSVRDAFVRIFDQSLRLQNPEYEDKRATKRLAMPQLRLLPAGTYTRLRQQRVTEGAPEAQVKIPLLSSHQSFASRLALLEV
ncbi:MAG: GH3 auxin-responsive promoter family protein, partial [Cyanobacteria bacterium]|nr:GH3 auxin-responsive promoter family protein [Cyanobacteriota bacterium]